MANISDSFKINLNQNLWPLIIGLLSLGISEYYKLCVLFWFAFIICFFMTISVIITFCFYTYRYAVNKLQ